MGGWGVGGWGGGGWGGGGGGGGGRERWVPLFQQRCGWHYTNNVICMTGKIVDRHLSSLVNIEYRVYKSRNDIFFRLVFEVKNYQSMRYIRVDSHFKVKDQINTVNMCLLHPNYVTLNLYRAICIIPLILYFPLLFFMSLIVLFFST